MRPRRHRVVHVMVRRHLMRAAAAPVGGFRLDLDALPPAPARGAPAAPARGAAAALAAERLSDLPKLPPDPARI